MCCPLADSTRTYARSASFAGLSSQIGPSTPFTFEPLSIVVSNGGTTLVHTLAHGRPLVAVPLAGDQDRRIRRTAKLQIAVSASRDPVEIAAAAASLLRDEGRQQAMLQRIAQMGIRNGVVEAVGALRSLAGRSLA